jgi:hypothetical protein
MPKKHTTYKKAHCSAYKKTIIACRGEEKKIITLPCAEKSR